jgi:hypothetical protein
LPWLTINNIPRSPDILHPLHPQKLINHNIALVIQQILGHIFCIRDCANRRDIQIDDLLFAIGEGEDGFPVAGGRDVGDSRGFGNVDVEFLELVFRECGNVGWDAGEELGAAGYLMGC